MTRKTQTANGIFQKPTRQQLERVAAFLPLAGPMPEKPGGADYGVVMQRGKQGTFAIKQQPVDVKESHAEEAAMANQFLVVQAIPRYMKHGFKGILMPCPYIRPKPKGLAEVGIAYFGGADPSDAKARQEMSPLDLLDAQGVHGIAFGAPAARGGRERESGQGRGFWAVKCQGVAWPFMASIFGLPQELSGLSQNTSRHAICLR